MASAYASEADLQETVQHELKGHVGIRRLFGDNITNEMTLVTQG